MALADVFVKKAGQTGDEAPEDWKNIVVQVKNVVGEFTYNDVEQQISTLTSDIAELESRKVQAEARLESIKNKVEE